MSGYAMGLGGPLTRDPFGTSSHGSSIMKAVLAYSQRFDFARYGSLVAFINLVPTSWTLLHNAWRELAGYVQHFFIASITVPRSDALWENVDTWLLDNIIQQRRLRFQTARSHFAPLREPDLYDPFILTLKKSTRAVQYSPQWEHIWFRHQGQIFSARRGSEYTRNKGEDLSISCFGRSDEPIREFIDKCRTYAERKLEFFVSIYSRERHSSGWRVRSRKRLRQLDTVYFDEEQKQALLADVRTYLDPRTQQLYASRSMPYRRGYLFYGPPGTGKSSLSTALAGEFGLDIYEVAIPSVSNDKELERMFQEVPESCIVLLEDIDAVWSGGGKPTKRSSSPHDESRSHVTLSGLLNVLDGVGSKEGRLMIMTTNRPEQLDSALVRPGRVDFKLHLGNISQASAEQMFLRMFAPDIIQPVPQSLSLPGQSVADPTGAKLPVNFPENSSDMERLKLLASEFGKAIPEDVFTPSQLQGFFQLHLESAIDASCNIADWVENQQLGARQDSKKV